MYKFLVLVDILFCFKGCYVVLKDEIMIYGKIFVGVGIIVFLIEVKINIIDFYICFFKYKFNLLFYSRIKKNVIIIFNN